MSKESLGTFSLLNRHTKVLEHSTLYRGFDERNASHIEKDWLPVLRAAREAQRDIDIADPRKEVRDAHWEWQRKLSEAKADALLSDVLVLECKEMTQAAMIIRKGGVHHLSLHPEHVGHQLVYVDYLATAPWNRVSFPEPLYKGCGQLMLAMAMNISIEDGYKGRIALRALKGAVTFYQEFGMTEIPEGTDEHGLRYFEVPASSVRSIFSRSPAVQGAGR